MPFSKKKKKNKTEEIWGLISKVPFKRSVTTRCNWALLAVVVSWGDPTSGVGVEVPFSDCFFFAAGFSVAAFFAAGGFRLAFAASFVVLGVEKEMR